MKKRYLQLVRRALRSLRHPRLRHRQWWQTLTRPIANRALWIPCRDTVATGLSIGLFFSLIPMPFQMVPSALFSMRAKANVPFAMAACWITNPITMGPILWGQYAFGRWMSHTLGLQMPEFISIHISQLSGTGSLDTGSFLLGVITSAILAALAAYPIVHLFSALMPHHLPVRKRKSRPPVQP